LFRSQPPPSKARAATRGKRQDLQAPAARALLGGGWPAHLARLEFELRAAQVDERRQLIDVAVAVVVERDIRREIERGARQLRRERSLGIGEVVIAVDENARRGIRDRRA